LPPRTTERIGPRGMGVVKEELEPLQQRFDLPKTYEKVLTSETPLAAEEFQNLRAYMRSEGLIKPDEEVPQGLIDYFQKQEQLKQEFKLPGMRGTQFNTGGRVGFAMGRRAFLGWIASLIGGVAGIKTGLIGFGKGVGKGKVAIKVGDKIIANTEGMPSWFIPLVNRITKEGTDVSKKLGTIEREIVHTKKISKTEEVTVYQDMNTGNVRIEYGPPVLNKQGKVIRASNDLETVHLEYKAPEVIEEGKHIGKKTKSEFSAAESEPEVVNWEGDIEWSGVNEVNKVDDLVTDTSKLKQFAIKKKPTMKEIVKSQKKQKYQQKLEKDQMEQIDYIEKKGGATIDDIVEEEAKVSGMADKRELSPDTKLMNLPKEYNEKQIAEYMKKIKDKKASGGRVDYDDYLPDIDDLD